MSHSDFDHKISPDLAALLNSAPKPTSMFGSAEERLAQLSARADRMTERGENRITAGAPDEPCLAEARREGVTIRKMADDPHCLRVSIGRTTFETAGDGTYCVYRGAREDVIVVMENVLAALRTADTQ